MTMPVLSSIGRGAATASRKPGVLLALYLANLAFALLVAWPFYALARADLGHSLLGRNLQTLDFVWLGELVYRYQSMAPAVAPWLLGSLLVYALLSVFLSGGTIGRLLDTEGGTTARSFFSDCGRYFGRFFRLFLAALPFYLLALGAVPAALSALLKPLDENARTAWTPFGLSLGRAALALLAVSVVHMIFDYARIRIVMEDDPGAFRALRAALLFIGRRFFRGCGLYLLITLGFLAGTGLAAALAGWFPKEGLFFAGAAAAGMQAYILFRLWTRMVFFAAQADYYRSVHP
jgi:hypothetical protein